MPTTSAPSVHGHDVIDLIRSARPPVTREALRALVAERCGSDPRFHTCSAQGMTLEALLAFLLTRGKVVEQDRVLRVVEANVCGAAH